jgi:hypothetical protein
MTHFDVEAAILERHPRQLDQRSELAFLEGWRDRVDVFQRVEIGV